MLPAGHRPATSWVHYTTSCRTQSSAPEDGQNNFPKHVELTEIINRPLFLHVVGCLCYLYQWCTVKQISDNEIYLLIKYIKSVLWRVAKRQSYMENAQCLKVKSASYYCRGLTSLSDRISILLQFPPTTSRWISETQTWNVFEKDELRLAVDWSIIDIASRSKLRSRF